MNPGSLHGIKKNKLCGTKGCNQFKSFLPVFREQMYETIIDFGRKIIFANFNLTTDFLFFK